MTYYKNNITKYQSKHPLGFTLIEIMIVMSIVALLMTMVGPLAMNSVEKANAKQEMLTMKNWLRKISYRAFTTGNSFQLKLSGKEAKLYLVSENSEQAPKLFKAITLESIFFQPQVLNYSTKGFVSPTYLEGMYGKSTLKLNLSEWVNSEQIQSK